MTGFDTSARLRNPARRPRRDFLDACLGEPSVETRSNSPQRQPRKPHGARQFSRSRSPRQKIVTMPRQNLSPQFFAHPIRCQQNPLLSRGFTEPVEGKLPVHPGKIGIVNHDRGALGSHNLDGSGQIASPVCVPSMRTRRKKHPGVKTEIGRDDEHARVYRLSDLLGRMWGIETRSRRNPVHIRFMIISRGGVWVIPPRQYWSMMPPRCKIGMKCGYPAAFA
jgi:hypothetical protein